MTASPLAFAITSPFQEDHVMAIGPRWSPLSPVRHDKAPGLDAPSLLDFDQSEQPDMTLTSRDAPRHTVQRKLST